MFRTTVTPRCWEAWAPCRQEIENSLPSYSLFQANYDLLTPVASSSQPSSRPATPLSDIDEDGENNDPFLEEIDIPLVLHSNAWILKDLEAIKFPNLITINTGYDPQLKENRIYTCPRKDTVRNFLYTSREREHAGRAYEPQTIQDLRNKASI